MESETKTKRNPPWQRDETILALDLYFRHHPRHLKDNDPVVVELSELLNQLPIHKERSETFRNPSSVIKKMWNLAKYDPDYPGVGLERGAKMDKIVWDEFAENQDYLFRVAQRIKSGFMIVEIGGNEGEISEEDEFAEGKIMFRLHQSRERNKKVIALAKKKAKAEGRLQCEVCDFDFAKNYGELGEGYIECHHTVPISEYDENSKTKIEDLAMVCSNCHRMLHRKRPWMSIAELREIRRNRMSVFEA